MMQKDTTKTYNKFLQWLLGCLFILHAFTSLNAQNFHWAKEGIGSGTDEGYAVCTDNTGNIFITGEFTSPTITFGSFTLTNLSGLDGYLVKYDAAGNALWAKSIVGGYAGYGNSVGADISGNIFLTGVFTTPAITFGSFTLTNAGSGNVFIVKYDASGNVLWAKSAGGNVDDEGYALSADASGNVFITGCFSSPSIAFGSFTLTNAGGGFAIFTAKYDASGNVLWAKSAGGTSYDAGCSVSADASGNVYLTGCFSSPSITFGSFTLTNAGSSYNIFIVKYDASGNVLWAKSAGGNLNGDIGYSVSADASGNVFITGFFSSPSITFGSFTLTNVGGGQAIFIVKYNASGNVLWAKSAGGNQNVDIGYSVSTDISGNAYLTGSFTGPSITFGSFTLTPPSFSTDPMFFAKFDANGNVLCASAFSSGGDDMNGVSADRFGNVFITGDFMANPFIVGYDTLIPAGGENVFVAKYSCCGGAGTTAITTNDTSIAQGQSVTLTANGGTNYVWSNGATGSAIVVSPTATTLYCVNSSDTANNCQGNACKTITVKTCESNGELSIPNVFSPNGDGVNDVFAISGVSSCYPFSLKIFDRWGIPIFETGERGFAWDGRTSAGLKVVEGTYYYVLTANGENKKGFVTLVR